MNKQIFLDRNATLDKLMSRSLSKFFFLNLNMFRKAKHNYIDLKRYNSRQLYLTSPKLPTIYWTTDHLERELSGNLLDGQSATSSIVH